MVIDIVNNETYTQMKILVIFAFPRLFDELIRVLWEKQFCFTCLKTTLHVFLYLISLSISLLNMPVLGEMMKGKTYLRKKFVDMRAS